MGKSLNKVMLIGNLGQDPEMRYTTSGIAVASFSIATSESWKNADGVAQEKTTWHNIVAWRKLAEICGEWLKKGKKVYIEGKLETQMWEKDGQKHYKTQIVVDNLIMLDGKPGQSATTSPAAEEGAAPEGGGKDDDLPF